MTRESLTLSVDSQHVQGNVYKPAPPPKKLALLFLHGWTGRPNELAAQQAANKGYYALTIAMRGHAPSDGDIRTISASDSLADAAAAYDYLQSEVPAETGIVAIGSSYGSYISVLLSLQRQLVALSLRVPANYPDGTFNQPKWGKGHEDPLTAQWRLKPSTYKENQALAAVHEFSGSIQILEAENDEVVPSQTVKNYVNAVGNPDQLEYLVMPGWQHSMGDDEERNRYFQQVLFSWLERIEKV